MLLLLLLVALCAQHIHAIESLIDTWQVAYYEPREALPTTMTWNYYCDVNMIHEAACEHVYPTPYNLLDNIGACYIHIVEADAYIDTHEQMMGVGDIFYGNSRVFMMRSEKLSKQYFVPPANREYIHSVLDGALLVVVNSCVTPSKKCAM